MLVATWAAVVVGVCVWVCVCAAVGCVLGFYGWRERERAKLRDADADADANGSAAAAAAAAAPPPLLLSSSLGSPPIIIMITIVALWRCVLVSISRRMSGWYSSSRLVECACPKHTRLCSSSSSTSSSTSSLFLISRTRVGGGGGVVVVGQAVWVAVWPCVCSAWRGVVVVVELVVSAQSSCFSPYYIGGERETSCDTPVVGIVQNAPCATTTATAAAAATTTDESSYYYCSHLLLVLLLLLVLVLVLVCSYLQMGRCVCVICSSKRAHVFRPSISDGSFANRTA